MKEPVRTIHKSHRSICLHSYQQPYQIKELKPKTTVYLLVQKYNNVEQFEYTIIKYLGLNSNSQFTYLPTEKPLMYLTNKSNILCDSVIEINKYLNLHVYWMRVIENLDIFRYKINYTQIPVINDAKSYIKTLFDVKKIYWLNRQNIPNNINFSTANLESVDDDIDQILAIGNINLAN